MRPAAYCYRCLDVAGSPCCVCLSVGHTGEPAKRLNRLSCRFQAGSIIKSRGPKEPCISLGNWDPGPPVGSGRGTLGETYTRYLGHRTRPVFAPAIHKIALILCCYFYWVWFFFQYRAKRLAGKNVEWDVKTCSVHTSSHTQPLACARDVRSVTQRRCRLSLAVL